MNPMRIEKNVGKGREWDMEQRLREVLKGREGNYLLPFYWQHGEEEGLLREGMRKIREAGIGAVCVESRPHPDFVGEGWWRDMDIILEEANQLDMRVWVLDDAHFPTGYANGKVGEDSPYGKVLLDYYHIDVQGPMEHGSFLIDLGEGESLAAVTAGLRKRQDQDSRPYHNTASYYRSPMSGNQGQETLYEVRDLTLLVEKGILYWNVPEGDWVVTVLKTTRKGKMRRGYINTLDREAVRFFLDTVYEPHYARYGEFFGGRFAGFFSDEPEIGNASEHYRIGHSQSPLPWCGQLEGMLKEAWGEAYGIRLTSLFCQQEGISPESRVKFMDLVTRLYGENFCGQIGDWCRAHGVEYIGHVIEDNGCHARLGLGTGHYFRALMGQDMAGIDVVLQQIRPGYGDGRFHAIGGKGTYDGRFFQYGLAAMGVSLAYQDAKKQGRTMCELYGAYGWAEGLKLMKWLADHMLVRGVNYFVPHAFTMKEFPDRDCPPHFYARGNNPQYPYFGYLMRYINRVSHLIQGGKPLWEVGILYHGFGEWAGEYMPFEEAGKLLAQAQIPYEVIPEDGVEELSCKVLVIPFCEYLPEGVLSACEKAAGDGVEVIFLEGMPKVLETGKIYTGKSTILQESELITRLRKLGVGGICCEPATEELRVFPYRQSEGDYYLCFNESTGKTVETTLSLQRSQGRVWWYDAFRNQLSPAQSVGDSEKREVSLRLAPYEARILYVGDAEEECVTGNASCPVPCCEEGMSHGKGLSGGKGAFMDGILSGNGWTLTLNEYGKTQPSHVLAQSTLSDVTSPENFPEFSGVMEYETYFDWPEEEKEVWVEIDCGEVYETMELWLNGSSLGVRLTPPYKVSGKGSLKKEGNHLKIRVINTLVHRQRDRFSRSLPIEPSGLLGPVKIGVHMPE